MKVDNKLAKINPKRKPYFESFDRFLLLHQIFWKWLFTQLKKKNGHRSRWAHSLLTPELEEEGDGKEDRAGDRAGQLF